MITETQTDEAPCPLCGCMTEPDIDGDHLFYECESDDCEVQGYAWGYVKVEEGTRIDGSCQVGVPEHVRRQASSGMEKAMSGGPAVVAGPVLPIRSA